MPPIFLPRRPRLFDDYGLDVGSPRTPPFVDVPVNRAFPDSDMAYRYGRDDADRPSPLPPAQGRSPQRPPLVLAPTPDPEDAAPIQPEPTPYPIRPTATRPMTMGIPTTPDIPTPAQPTPRVPPIQLPDADARRPSPDSGASSYDAMGDFDRAAPDFARPQRATAPPLADYRGNAINDPAGFQRDQFVRRGGTTDAAGNFKAKRSGKDIALSALWGLLQGAGEGRGLAGGIGGALMGGLGATINPTWGREYRFNVEQAPRLQADQQRQQETEQRERQRVADDLRLQQLQRQAQIDAITLADLPQERKLKLARIEAEIADIKARAAERGRPPLTDWEADAEGNARYRDGRLVIDPATNKPIRVPPRQQTQRGRYVDSDNNYRDANTNEIIRDASGVPIKAPPRFRDTEDPLAREERVEERQINRESRAEERAVATAADRELNEVAKLKAQAVAAQETAARMPTGTDWQRAEQQEAQVKAQAALAAYNNAVQTAAERYPDHLEALPGQGGWGYLQRRQRPQRPARTSSTSGVAPGAGTANLSELEKLWK